MITITRNLARKLRLMAKRGLGWSGRHAREAFQCQVKDGKLRIDAVSNNVSLTYVQETEQMEDRLMFPITALALCEGKTDEPVTFEFPDDKHIHVAWQDGSIPQVRELEARSDPAVRICAPINIESESWSVQPPHFLTALRDAVATTEQSPSRYALNCLQLRGTTGAIAATDGRQILVQGGMSFPWQEDLLVQGSDVFNSPVIAHDQSVLVAKTDTHVLFQFGCWTIGFKIQTDLRFPKIDALLGSKGSAESRVDFSAADRRFLLDTIPKLPCYTDQHQSLTVELNGKIAVRAKSEQQSTATELVLTSSQRLGPDIRINTNRFYLKRALEMGFPAMTIYGTNVPIQCYDQNRTYLWALLSPEHALKSSENDVSIESSSHVISAKPHRKIDRSPVEPAEAEIQPQTSNSSTSNMINTNRATKPNISEATSTYSVNESDLSPWKQRSQYVIRFAERCFIL